MANFDFDVVVKIGSMALIRKEDNDLDYNIFNRLASELKPGYILVSSGATEIGRIDYMKRNGGMELRGDLKALLPRTGPGRLRGEMIVKAACHRKSA